MNVNVGLPREEALEAIERFASEVMPHFAEKLPLAARQAASV